MRNIFWSFIWILAKYVIKPLFYFFLLFLFLRFYLFCFVIIGVQGFRFVLHFIKGCPDIFNCSLQILYLDFFLFILLARNVIFDVVILLAFVDLLLAILTLMIFFVFAFEIDLDRKNYFDEMFLVCNYLQKIYVLLIHFNSNQFIP